MRSSLKAVLPAVVILLSLAGIVAAQAGRNRQAASEQKNEARETEDAPADANQQEVETVKVETNLVTVPVVASDRGGKYIPDLKREEFTLFQDGSKQEISFFETVTAPFNVVLMLDTSASTQEKLGQIQQAAIAFTEQLQKADRVKVISFDDQVHNLSDFSSDRAVLQWAIRETRPGQGTKLYDAMRIALNALQRIKGRKAIVIFTDGVDSFSDRETYDKNVRMIEEAGVIVYPIRYDTREEVERLVRQQQQSGQVIDLASILGGKSTTTPTTFPGGGQTPVPTGRTGGGIGTTFPRLPGGVVITSSKNGRNNPYPNDPNNPYPRDPNDPNYPSPSTGGRAPNDNVSAELDLMYKTANAYLRDLADKSGGGLFRADTLGSLPLAFAQIAAELRTQYSLSYYPPPEAARDGKYHKIKVTTQRSDVAVRARPGYRAPVGAK